MPTMHVQRGATNNAAYTAVQSKVSYPQGEGGYHDRFKMEAELFRRNRDRSTFDWVEGGIRIWDWRPFNGPKINYTDITWED